MGLLEILFGSSKKVRIKSGYTKSEGFRHGVTATKSGKKENMNLLGQVLMEELVSTKKVGTATRTIRKSSLCTYENPGLKDQDFLDHKMIF